MATSAFAQDATQTSPDTTQTVVITGSRIIRNGYSAPTPVTVATTSDLEATTPSSIPDGLNKLPVFSGSAATSGASNIVGGTGGGSAVLSGGAYLNLRNMGEIRTLVLLDGRRVPGTAINSQVDTNTLPQMLVQRVDVVTGGASAVYGSDAVVGVVNFVLDKNYNGLKAFGQVGDSTYGDDRSYRFGVAGGGEVFGRAHVIWSYEQYQNNGVDSKAARPWSNLESVYTGAGSIANPYVLTNYPRLNTTSATGLATNGPFSGQQFNSSGTALTPFVRGAPTKTSTIDSGGEGGAYTDIGLIPPLETKQGFAHADFDLVSDVKAYIQLSDSESEVTGWNTPPPISATIFSGNPYLPASAQAQLTACPTNATTGLPTANSSCSFTLSKIANDLGQPQSSNQLTDDLNVTAGLTGKTFGNFVWDAYYTHGTSIVRYKNNNSIYYPNLYSAIDAVTGPNGQPACRVNTGLYAGCQPINLFGSGNASSQALAFIYQNTDWQAVNTLDDFAASLAGDAFNDWAGPVSVAANFEYRSQSLTESSGADPNLMQPTINYNLASSPPVPTSYAGLAPEGSGITIPNAPWDGHLQTAMHGSNSVWEISGETVIPLVKDLFLAKSADLSGAFRYTDYSTSGSVETWKVGFNYQPIDDLRIRFVESRDIRAPTLYDLFAPATLSYIGFSDPLTGKSNTIGQVSGGNPNLKPEISYTTTAGFVYSPSWLPRFRMSIDYYNISMTNVISSINGSSATILGVCDASGGTAAVCSSVVRPLPYTNTTTANFPSYITNYSQNIASAYTHGIDLEASYYFMLGDMIRNAPGRFDIRLLNSYQPVLNETLFPGSPNTALMGVAGASADRFTANVNYRIGPVSVAYEMRWLSSQNRGGSPTTVYGQPPLPGIFYHDINLSYDFKAGGHPGQLYFVVDNLLNQFPRVSPLTNFTSNPGNNGIAVLGDDQVGRYFTLGFRAQY